MPLPVEVFHAVDGDGSAICDTGSRRLVAYPVLTWDQVNPGTRCPACAAILSGDLGTFSVGT